MTCVSVGGHLGFEPSLFALHIRHVNLMVNNLARVVENFDNQQRRMNAILFDTRTEITYTAIIKAHTKEGCLKSPNYTFVCLRCGVSPIRVAFSV